MGERIGIGCIVVREDADAPVLLLRRAFGQYEGQWCSVAGHVESGELPHEAASRELREETGIDEASFAPLFVHRGEAGLDIHAFAAWVRGAPAIVLNSEHSEWRWASWDVARELLPLEAQRSALEQARQLVRELAAIEEEKR